MASNSKRELKDTFVRGCKPAVHGKRYYVWDTKVQGFGLQVTDKGAKSYILYARVPPSWVPTRRRIGDATKMTLAAARRMAQEWVQLVAEGKDPAAVQRAHTQVTFGKAAEDWFTDVVRHQRKGKEVTTDVKREFVSRWGNKPITTITALDVRDAVRTVNQRAPAQARNVFGYAKRLFDWAVAQHAYGLAQSPMEKLRAKDLVDKKVIRHRVLTDHELRTLWQIAETIGYPYGPLFQMLALTGQRKSEVAEARWREFNLEQKIWTIPPERMKGGAAHVVPLSDDVLALLNDLPRFKGDYVFSTTLGKTPVNGFSKAKARVDAALSAALGSAPDDWVIHDIRRTMRTRLSGLPIEDRVRELVIAHAQPGLHQVYDQYAWLDEKRTALVLWAGRLRGIVTSPPANVVALHGGAA
jgi:integrase